MRTFIAMFLLLLLHITEYYITELFGISRFVPNSSYSFTLFGGMLIGIVFCMAQDFLSIPSSNEEQKLKQ